MKIQIIKTNDQFQMQCPYNLKVLKSIHKCQKRCYCRHTKTWYLPLEEYQSIRDALPEFEFEVIESKTMVFIKTLPDRIEIKFSKFIKDYKKYLDFNGKIYNSTERKLSMPKEHLEKVLVLSKELDYDI